MGNKQRVQSGAVSLIVVILSALLLTVLAVGFVTLMLQGQQRAQNQDLSQSAYDSALAGVEDAKRVLRQYAQGNERARNALAAANDCQVIARAGIAGDVAAPETVIRSTLNAADSALRFDQAYTCVNIDLDTPDFLLTVRGTASDIVPLRATGSFDRVVIEWYTQANAGVGNAASGAATAPQLPRQTAWNGTTPPVLRAQTMTPGSSFTIDSLNASSGSQTVFLMPGAATPSGATNTHVNLSTAIRATSPGEYNNAPTTTNCSRDFSNNGYACKVTLILPSEVSQAASDNAVLRLQALYANRGVDIRVSLYNGATLVNFNGVQPMVDATGRANDLFRRVEARLRTDEAFNYPDYAVDSAESICKDFSVVESGDAIPGGCSP